MTKDIKIDKDICNLIETLHYEVNAAMDLMAYMLSSGMDTNTDSFKKYQKDYIDCHAKYNLAKEEMEKMYIKSIEQQVKRQIKWNLSFDTEILTLEWED